jgi:hypothetical protein
MYHNDTALPMPLCLSTILQAQASSFDPLKYVIDKAKREAGTHIVLSF